MIRVQPFNFKVEPFFLLGQKDGSYMIGVGIL